MAKGVRGQRSAGSEVNRQRARDHAAALRPTLIELRAQGHTYARIAELLNARGLHTRRGVRWSGENVRCALLLPLQ